MPVNDDISVDLLRLNCYLGWWLLAGYLPSRHSIARLVQSAKEKEPLGGQ